MWEDRFSCVWMRSKWDASYECPSDGLPVMLPTSVASVGNPLLMELNDGEIAIPSFDKIAIGRPGRFRVMTALAEGNFLARLIRQGKPSRVHRKTWCEEQCRLDILIVSDQLAECGVPSGCAEHLANQFLRGPISKASAACDTCGAKSGENSRLASASCSWCCFTRGGAGLRCLGCLVGEHFMRSVRNQLR